MGITTLVYGFFLLLSVIAYYIFPKKNRWIILLLSSLTFFFFACSWYLIIYLLLGIISTYFGTNLFYNKGDKTKKIWLAVTLLIIISVLFLLKYINIFPVTFNLFGKLFDIDIHFTTFNILAPLGISYYTLSLIGYVVDVYRGVSLPQKNILKHALFSCYYPAMVSGPILRYEEMKSELFEPKSFDFNNLFLGFYRIVFGLLKKMVIADNLGIIVSLIFKDYNTYSGPFIIIGVVFYALQIYADFSGCMDIVIGSSKLYGVKLPENFDSPLFSRSLPEFWRRWHVSLGVWAKDYIMYPLLKSTLFQKLGKKTKEIFGKRIGKLIPTFIAIFILWLLIGLWHGASYKYIFAAGILPWFFLVISESFESVPKKINSIFKIKTECFSFYLFQALRTLGFMCIIWLVVCSPGLTGIVHTLKAILHFPALGFTEFFAKYSISIIFISYILVIFVDYLNYKKINAFEKFSEQNIWFRWIILLFVLAIIVIYGIYGPGYNPADFIYGRF